jgi:hypothetical protein
MREEEEKQTEDEKSANTNSLIFKIAIWILISCYFAE